jgi:hypothetical protein
VQPFSFHPYSLIRLSFGDWLSDMAIGIALGARAVHIFLLNSEELTQHTWSETEGLS